MLGGILYFLNNSFAYKASGLVFYHNSFSINMVILIIFSPLLLYIYIKQLKCLKNNYASYYKLEIKVKNKVLKLVGFLDTGNKLKDPYQNRPIILMNKKDVFNGFKKVLIPYTSITKTGLLECVLVKEIYVENIGAINNVLIGFISEKIKIVGVDCLLQNKLLEKGETT
jgi:hypothetical protein